MSYVGGLRARLIRDSLWTVIDEALRDLGWYTPTPTHAPVSFVTETLDLNQQVPPNTVALSDEGDTPEEIELGSNLAEVTWPFYVDVYGENDDLALHLVGDIAAALAGRLPAIGRDRAAIEVYDFSMATPTVAFVVEVQAVRTEKAHDWPQPWLRFWRTCTFELVDDLEDS